jgi:hypothetical protein
MLTGRYDTVIKGIQLAPFLLLLIALPACAGSAVSTMPPISPQERTQLIQRLEEAKKLDWNNALDPVVSPVRQESFLNRMNKADRAIRELKYGFEVPQQEITDALWVPPKSISSQERAQLIEQLQEARRQDDKNGQTMLNDSGWRHSAAPIDTVTFDQQKKLVDEVIKDLEIHEPIHWSTSNQALYVPPSPY